VAVTYNFTQLLYIAEIYIENNEAKAWQKEVWFSFKKFDIIFYECRLSIINYFYVLKYQLYNLMNSPQPPAEAGQALSASQRGAKCFTPPSFDRKRRWQGG
jgi:hypothetical protein